MFTEKQKLPRRRGRPPGRTAEGDATRRRLYETAIALIKQRGYEAATLRDVATQAGVSPASLYRHFPSKRAVVLALYDELSGAFAVDVGQMPAGKWRVRVLFALQLSLAVLEPHRVALRALAPVIVSDGEDGVFGPASAASRLRVQKAFQVAVADATDAPRAPLADALGRVMYLLHLGVILWWLLDRSAGQRATAALVELLRQILPSAALATRLPPVRRFILAIDSLFQAALLGTVVPVGQEGL